MRRQRNLLGPQGMGGLVSLWGASSLIKSIQTGTAYTSSGSVTATITAVNTANSIIINENSSSVSSNPNLVVVFGFVALTNATTVTVTQSAAFLHTFGFTVIEFMPGVLRSVQSGYLPASGTSVAATITAVDTAKSFVVHMGQSSGTSAPYSDAVASKMTLTNATTVTVNTGNSSSANCQWQVIEWF